VTDARYDGVLGAVGVSLVFGLIIMVMVYATGHLSGAHINPAVTIAFTLSRHFPPRDAAAYLAGQLAGAAAGALVLLAVWPDQPGDLGATVPTVGAGSAFVYELVLTAFLMFVIMAVATDTRAVGAAAAIAIGGTVGLDALFGGPVTGASMNPARSFGPALAVGGYIVLAGLWSSPVSGASMNPARSFGPALVSGDFSSYWVYLVGPLLGAAAAVGLAVLLRGAGGDAGGRAAARGDLETASTSAEAGVPAPRKASSDAETRPGPAARP